ncbi:hypothetical protein RQP46_009523 [Phenoliferia psychrophenolica]
MNNGAGLPGATPGVAGAGAQQQAYPGSATTGGFGGAGCAADCREPHQHTGQHHTAGGVGAGQHGHGHNTHPGTHGVGAAGTDVTGAMNTGHHSHAGAGHNTGVGAGVGAGGVGATHTNAKPSMGDKVMGAVQEKIGDMTKNPEKEELGAIRKTEGKAVAQEAARGGAGGLSENVGAGAHHGAGRV